MRPLAPKTILSSATAPYESERRLEVDPRVMNEYLIAMQVAEKARLADRARNWLRCVEASRACGAVTPPGQSATRRVNVARQERPDTKEIA